MLWSLWALDGACHFKDGSINRCCFVFVFVLLGYTITAYIE
jgi:hypothetical protein